MFAIMLQQHLIIEVKFTMCCSCCFRICSILLLYVIQSRSSQSWLAFITLSLIFLTLVHLKPFLTINFRYLNRHCTLRLLYLKCITDIYNISALQWLIIIFWVNLIKSPFASQLLLLLVLHHHIGVRCD